MNIADVDDSADRFDRDEPSNQPESRPNNNVPGRAVRIGAEGEFAWNLVKDLGLGQQWELRIRNLNFHQSDDEDWFNIVEVPSSFNRGRCQPKLEILYSNNFEAAGGADPNAHRMYTIEPERSFHDLQLAGELIPDAPLWLRLSPNPEASIGTGAIDDYDLVLRFFSVKSGIPLLNVCPF